jgi:transcriptional regulator with XRE-family HTH domain
MRDETLSAYRRALSDYRLALGLDLKTRRDAAGCSLLQLSTQTGTPAETLRSYEKGIHHPQLIRLASIGAAYNVSALNILITTAEYIYRANGAPIPDPNLIPPTEIALRAVILYCAVTPTQLPIVESPPPHQNPIDHNTPS